MEPASGVHSCQHSSTSSSVDRSPAKTSSTNASARRSPYRSSPATRSPARPTPPTRSSSSWCCRPVSGSPRPPARADRHRGVRADGTSLSRRIARRSWRTRREAGPTSSAGRTWARCPVGLYRIFVQNVGPIPAELLSEEALERSRATARRRAPRRCGRVHQPCQHAVVALRTTPVLGPDPVHGKRARSQSATISIASRRCPSR